MTKENTYKMQEGKCAVCTGKNDVNVFVDKLWICETCSSRGIYTEIKKIKQSIQKQKRMR